VCLEHVQQDVRDEVHLELVWKSFLLRPRPEPRTIDKFRRYTESWMRPAGQADAGEFRVWATDEDPPSHSIPPAIAVKASERQGAFDRYHRALMHAYFARNLNVTSMDTMMLVASECDLDVATFARDLGDPALLEKVIGEHNEAVELGITGVPCVVLEGGFQLPGAQERAVYKRIIQRLVAKSGVS
jgi:predicted DsbA family dithiol-disulfide isomerase